MSANLSPKNDTSRAMIKSAAIPFFLAIFFNAFVDLGHKITLQNIVFKVHDGSEQVMLIAVINALILLPYILLFIPVGRVADAFAKPQLMRYAAWFSLACVLCIAVFYFLAWFWMAFAMTVLMAVQSTFYSPAKLAYIKTLFGEQGLAKANGWAQSSVIAGILLATLVFSLGFEYLYNANSNAQTLDKPELMQSVAVLGFGLITIAILQLLCVYRIPVLAENANSQHAQSLTQPLAEGKANDSNKPAGILASVLKPPFLLPICGLALFWAIGQGMLAVFPAFAKMYAGITNVAVIQFVMAMSALGIVMGGWLVGVFSKQQINFYCVVAGVLVLSIGLWSLTWLKSAAAFAICYLLLGIASALIIVPFNAYIQQLSPLNRIGSMIAGSNLCQNLAMLAMLLLTISMALLDWDARLILQLMALLATVAGAIIAYRVLSLKLS